MREWYERTRTSYTSLIVLLNSHRPQRLPKSIGFSSTPIFFVLLYPDSLLYKQSLMKSRARTASTPISKDVSPVPFSDAKDRTRERLL